MLRFDLSPDDPRAVCLMDHVNEYLEQLLGPDEKAAEIRLCTLPFKLVVLTDHGMRLTLEDVTGPSAN